ncbi:hypothetical protein ACPCYX_31950, partial [Pseudomonas fluorescens]|uniref:hypothetical protein n=1 Tax=Pseudomonas fluorescens TaxID=294 RepID=UPI003C2406BC
YCRRFFAGLARFAPFPWLTLFTRLTWCAFFPRCTLFARLALFIAATVPVAVLLETAATLFVVRRTLGGRFFNHNQSGRT